MKNSNVNVKNSIYNNKFDGGSFPSMNQMKISKSNQGTDRGLSIPGIPDRTKTRAALFVHISRGNSLDCGSLPDSLSQVRAAVAAGITTNSGNTMPYRTRPGFQS